MIDENSEIPKEAYVKKFFSPVPPIVLYVYDDGNIKLDSRPKNSGRVLFSKAFDLIIFFIGLIFIVIQPEASFLFVLISVIYFANFEILVKAERMYDKIVASANNPDELRAIITDENFGFVKAKVRKWAVYESDTL